MSRIAIIGMSCIFPGASSLAHYWRNIVNGVDAISDVPAARWDASFYDPSSTAIDRFYCKRGGFVDDYAHFDPLAFGIMPKAAEATEPDQLLTLKMGYAALKDAGYLDGAAEKTFARDKTGVIIGRGNYITAGGLRLEQHVRMLPQLLQTMQDLFPELPANALELVRERVQAELPYYGPDVAAGFIPNLIASRLANRLDLHGPAYTVDAACASSLIAVEQACNALASGNTDMMLVGGAHLSHDLTFWATFCQLGALSRSSTISPFSQNADGLLAGEGIGMLVLKRLDDAQAAGDRIYAVIEGVGSASDGRSGSVVSPSAQGQQRALANAWANVPFAPESIGLVEAHGTGTPAGDAAELESMGAFFGVFEDKSEDKSKNDGMRPVIGSVKSMIGHTMPAAGMAGMIKAAMAVYHGILPPTLHCDEPHALLKKTRFRVISQQEPWPQARSERIAAVNAFGFGGINAHVVLRGGSAARVDNALALNQSKHALRQVPDEGEVKPALLKPSVLTLSANTPAELLARLERGERDAVPIAALCRLAIVEPDEKKLTLARKIVAAGKPWGGRSQIYFSAAGLLQTGGKIAFVFPGVDSRFAPQAEDLAAFFQRPLPPFCETLDPQTALPKVVQGLMGFNRFLFAILGELGIEADAMAGHSVGEWSAMTACGMLDQALSDRTNAAIDLDAVSFPDVRFLAANCDESTLLTAMQGLEKIALSHDNCPHQVIACGTSASIAKLANRLREMAVITQLLPIVSGFHSPLFKEHISAYRDFFLNVELVDPHTPLWSATNGKLFPPTQEEKQHLAVAHLLEPVRFRSVIAAMYEAGFRVFVQVGTGSLPGFINDSLSGLPHLAIAANKEGSSGLAQLVNVCAALWVEGALFDKRLLCCAPAVPSHTEERENDARGITLALGVPLLRIPTALDSALLPLLDRRNAEMLPVDMSDPVQLLMRETLADIERAGRDVVGLWQKHAAQKTPPPFVVSQSNHASPQIDRRRDHCVSRILDISSTIPYVADHALYPQRTGWPIAEDCHPVVPMTMEVMLVREAVEEWLADKKVIELCQIQAYNWLVVAKPCTVSITLKWREDGMIGAEIEGYFRAQVQVADHYPVADNAQVMPLENARATEIIAEELYADNWMFHGRAYQGVETLCGIGDNGIDGALIVPHGKGALLDNMGQLAGYWVMEQPDNCLAMPIGIDRIRFFSDDPAVGERLHNTVRISQLDNLNCVTNHVLTDNSGSVRINIDGWKTRRYQMDKNFWLASRQLASGGVSHALSLDIALFDDRYDTAILRDYLARRYLSTPEMAVYDTLAPKRRRQWLNGRVAAKDAVRSFLRKQRGIEHIYPKELRIENDERGVPIIKANITNTVPESLFLSLAHKEKIAVAMVSEQAVGIDIELIAAHDESFIALLLSKDERERLGNEPLDIAITRAWVAKEAVAKTQGTGLGGQLRSLVIEARTGDNVCVNGVWVTTQQRQQYIVGWTVAAQSDTSTLRQAQGERDLLNQPLSVRANVVEAVNNKNEIVEAVL